MMLFDSEEDKKALRQAIKDIKLKKWQSLGRVLFVIKIGMMYIFAFVGFSFLFIYFLLGQNLVCNKQKVDIVFDQDTSAINPINDSVYLQWCHEDNIRLRKQYDDCRAQLTNFTDSCEAYCIQSVFEPVCNKYVGGFNG